VHKCVIIVVVGFRLSESQTSDRDQTGHQGEILGKE